MGRLKLKRHLGQSVLLDEGRVRITVTRIGHTAVELLVEAPDDCAVEREEAVMFEPVAGESRESPSHRPRRAPCATRADESGAPAGDTLVCLDERRQVRPPEATERDDDGLLFESFGENTAEAERAASKLLARWRREGLIPWTDPIEDDDDE